MRYISRKYIAEKWDSLKWDMDVLLSGDEDQVTEEELQRVKANIADKMNAISCELGIGEVEW